MHGRADTVRLLIERDADLTDCAFDDEGSTPLDCAIWGLQSNRADDGDYFGTIEALVKAGAPTGAGSADGEDAIDAVLAQERPRT